MICISAVIHRWLLVSGVCDLIAFTTMYLFAPVAHPNKELNLKEKKANKMFAMITTLFCILNINYIGFIRIQGRADYITNFVSHYYTYVCRNAYKCERREKQCQK